MAQLIWRLNGFQEGVDLIPAVSAIKPAQVQYPSQVQYPFRLSFAQRSRRCQVPLLQNISFLRFIVRIIMQLYALRQIPNASKI